MYVCIVHDSLNSTTVILVCLCMHDLRICEIIIVKLRSVGLRANIRLAGIEGTRSGFKHDFDPKFLSKRLTSVKLVRKKWAQT